MKFWHFSQNNSGGSFDFSESEGITHHVVIEAESAEDANVKAIQKGLYFDGCDTGQDCPCCGDRWHRQWDSNAGDKLPSIYGQPLGTEGGGHEWMKPGKETAVHFADGRIEWFGADNLPATGAREVNHG